MASLYINKSSGQWIVKYYWKSRPFYDCFASKPDAESHKQTIEQDISLAKRLKRSPRFLAEKPIETNFTPDSLNPTVEAFPSLFLADKKHLDPDSHAAYSYAWKSLAATLSVKRLGQLTSQHIRDWRDNAALGDVSKNTYLHSIVVMLNWAVQKKHIKTNPALGVPALRLDNNPKPYLTRDEINKLLLTAADHGQDIYRYCMLCTLAGCRKLEALNARWEWLSFGKQDEFFKGGTLTIQSGQGFRVKNRQNRTIPLHRSLSLHLQTNQQQSGYIIKPDRNYGGDRWDFRSQLETVLKNAGLETVNRYGRPQPVTSHTLRHTFCSMLAQNKYSAYEIMQYAGHSDIKVSMGYMHLQPTKLDLNF